MAREGNAGRDPGGVYALIWEVRISPYLREIYFLFVSLQDRQG